PKRAAAAAAMRASPRAASRMRLCWTLWWQRSPDLELPAKFCAFPLSGAATQRPELLDIVIPSWARRLENSAPALHVIERPRGAKRKRSRVMKGFVQDIEDLAVKSVEFRRVLYTAKNCQLVLMALKPKEEIGAEVHKLDQFFRVEEGTGEAVLDGVRTAIQAGWAVVVPTGTNHNIVNTGSVPLKLYTLYAPPNHRDGVVHHTRADAEADNEHFRRQNDGIESRLGVGPISAGAPRARSPGCPS